MSKILGYGEDALTLWLLKNQPQKVLKKFNDKTEPSDCLVFYRPSFGRSGGPESAEFGEFDAILASKENIYLIESKWDNHRKVNQKELNLRTEQTKRHDVFRWYLRHWNSRYANDWSKFVREKGVDFVSNKKIAPESSLLSANLQQILSRLHEHCPNCTNTDNIKNVMLFFHSSKSKSPEKCSEGFSIIPIKYEGDYVTLS